MTRKSCFSFSHPYDIRCYMRRLTQWEMRRSLITSREYEKDTFLPLSGLALVITLVVIYFWGKRKQPHLTHSRTAKFSNKSSLLRLNKLDLINRHFPTCFKGRKKLSHITHCQRVKFHRKRSTSRNKGKYVVKYSIHHLLLFEITISESTLVWTQRLYFMSKARRFDRYHIANLSQFLLLLSGDVESNPGPYTDGDVKEVLQTICAKTLSEYDWDEVVSALEPLESRWRDIGRKLGMLPSTIDSISADHSQCGPCLSEVIKHWLKLNYDASKFGQPSWRKLAEAVSGLDMRLFYSLANDHKTGGEESLSTKNEQACLSGEMKLSVQKPLLKDNAEAPPLSVENVATILEQFSLNEVCEMLYIPNAKLDAIKSEFSTDNKRLRALIQYWLLKDIRASWRRLIIQLDNMSLTKTAAAAAADSIRNYAEMLTDSSLTHKRVLAALDKVKDDMDGSNELEYCLDIPDKIREEMREQSGSFFKYRKKSKYRKKIVKYWLKYHPNASWEGLAGKLLNIRKERALEKVKRNIFRPKKDPSLTLTNLTQLMENVNYVRYILNIPDDVNDDIRKQHSNNSKCKEIFSEWYLNNHPAPSWQHIADGLYWNKEHEVLEVLYLKGNSSEGSTQTIPLPASDTPHLTGELRQPDGDSLSATQTLDSQLTSFKNKPLPSSGEEEKCIDADPPCTASGAVPNPTTSPQIESSESNKRKKEKAKFEAPPLSVENVATILEKLSLNDVCDMLYIPDAKLATIKSEFSTDKERLRALIQYWLLRDPYASWRRLIIQLEKWSKATAANSIRNYAEKLTDPTLTYSRVLTTLDSVKDCMNGSDDLENCLGTPDKIDREMREQSSSAIIYRKKLVKYWLKYHPNASWEYLAGRLLRRNQKQALDKVKRNIFRPKKDPSLTLTNLTQLMENVNDMDYVKLSLNIPNDVYYDINKQHSNDSKHMETLSEWYLNNHPAPSWQHIADGLYSHPSQHEALEVLRTLYLKGSRESRRLCDEAMKNGHVKSQINKIVLYGPGGAGKSSFLEMVTGNSPPEVRISTPMAARPVQLFQIDTTSKEWVKLSPTERKEILARATMGAKRQLVEETMNQTDSKDVNMTGYQIDSEDDSDEEAEMPVGSSIATEQLSSIQDTQPQMHPSTTKPTPHTAGEVSQPDRDSTLHAISTKGDLAELMDSFSTSGNTLTSIHKLQIIDSGGQPQFHEILPKFLRRMTLYIFVLKLSEDLTTKPMVEYFNQSGRIGTPYQSFHTNEQLIEHCLRTVHTHRSNTKSDRECSRIMVVGTHLDEESKCTTESREEKNKKLEKLLLPMFKNEVMYYGDKFIFPVNAKNPGDHEKYMVKLIQHDISTNCSPEPIDVPLQYYGLELLLEESGRGVLSKEECLQAALDLHFDEHTLDAALQFLDEMSVVFYFPEILPGVVFTNPQVLLDKVTELVEETYHLRKGGSLVISGDMQEFRDHGRFSLKFLGKFKKHYVPGLFTSKELVKLFKKLLIIAEFSSTEFFMPALLPVLEDEEIPQYRISEDSPAVALALDFPLGAPRLGTYCTLSCFLVSSDNQFPCPWKIKLRPHSNTPIVLYRNCIQFIIPGYPGSVTLIDTFKHFEVHVNTSSEICSKFCSFVRQAILSGIKKAVLTLGYNNCTPSPALLCPCGVGDPHVATFCEGLWICIKDTNKFGPLTSNHLMWQDHADSTALQGPLDLKTVRNALWEARSKWYDIGVELDVETSTLDVISTECQGKVEDCFRKILTKWLNRVTPQPSWSALVEALESPAVDHSNLADKIRSKYMK